MYEPTWRNGRRTGLKILRAQAHVGSTPTVGTNLPSRYPLILRVVYSAAGYTVNMIDEDAESVNRVDEDTRDRAAEGVARDRAAAYVLQRYHLTSLREAQEKLTPAQFAGVTRQIDQVQDQILGRARPVATVLPTTTRGIDTPLGPILPATGLLLVAIWLMFGLEALQPGGALNPTDQMLVTLGATTPDMLATHQYWRLLAACFLHIGFVHIATNSIALVWLGSLAERFYGSLRFLGIYLATGVVGNIAAALLEPGLGAGASGAIFGILGAMLVGSWRNRGAIGPDVSRALFGSLAGLLAINIAISFIPGISKFAHFGGLLTGGVLALLIPFSSPRYPRAYTLASNVISAALIVVTLALGLTYFGAH